MSEPNECPFLIEVHRLREGEIDATRAGEVRQHMARCSSCRAEYESWDRLSELLARGDPASPLVPERQRRMKDKLLQDGAASLDEAGDAPRRQSAPRWRMPVRIALGLAPLAAALLLLLHLGPGVRPGEPRSPRVAAHSGAALPEAQHEALPRQRQIAVAPELPLPRVQTNPKVSPRAVKRLAIPKDRPPAALTRRREDAKTGRSNRQNPGHPSSRLRVFASSRSTGNPFTAQGKRRRRALRPYRIADASRSVPAPRDRSQGSAFRRTRAAAPAGKRMVASHEAGLAAPRPIERLVIQVDGPPSVRPVEASTATHITVIATGDPAAPGAQLTVVKSQREETLP